MKFLLVAALVLVAVWVWRNNRRNEQPPPPVQRPPLGPVAMVACDRCGTHLPQDESVKGERGVYCCQEHRRQTEQPSG